MLTLGVLKEPSGEARVSITPEVVALLQKLKVAVLVEKGAGLASYYSDAQYAEAGAELIGREEIFSKSQVITSLGRLSGEDLRHRFSGVLIGMYQPLYHYGTMALWAESGMTVFSLDMLPRTTRAQSMDVLSSQANIAGYKAVLLAATHYPRYFPMLMTAAGSVAPAKVLILGAGVAGLQAIATARRLGAVVEVFDTRPAVKEEVMSLGAKFVEVDGVADASKAGGYAVEQSEEFERKQQSKIAEHALKADVIITTAQIPGKAAPILLHKETIEKMKAGAVIIDLASATGGNTEITKDGEVVTLGGVRVIGDSALAATVPSDASKLFSKNVHNFLRLIINDEGRLDLNFEDELVKGACICHDGKIKNERLVNLR